MKSQQLPVSGRILEYPDDVEMTPYFGLRKPHTESWVSFCNRSILAEDKFYQTYLEEKKLWQ